MRRITVLAIVGVVMATAACGGEQPAPVASSTSTRMSSTQSVPAWTPSGLVAAMKAATAKQGSADVRVSITGTGTADFTSVGQINVGTPYAMRMRYDRQDGAATVLITGDEGFVQGPGVPAGKWAPMSPADVQLQSGQAGVDGYFAAFEAGGRQVKYLGRESVRGVSASKFAFAVDAAAALSAQGKAVPANLPDTIAYTLWLDDKNLMRKVEMELGPTRVSGEMDWHAEHLALDAPRADLVLR